MRSSNVDRCGCSGENKVPAERPEIRSCRLRPDAICSRCCCSCSCMTLSSFLTPTPRTESERRNFRFDVSCHASSCYGQDELSFVIRTSFLASFSLEMNELSASKGPPGLSDHPIERVVSGLPALASILNHCIRFQIHEQAFQPLATSDQSGRANRCRDRPWRAAPVKGSDLSISGAIHATAIRQF